MHWHSFFADLDPELALKNLLKITLLSVENYQKDCSEVKLNTLQLVHIYFLKLLPVLIPLHFSPQNLPHPPVPDPGVEMNADPDPKPWLEGRV